MRVAAGLAVLLVATLGGCGGSDKNTSSASCAYLVKFEDVQYLGTFDYVDPEGNTPTLGDKIGTAKPQECAENKDPEATKTHKVYQLTGIDPKWAIAFGEPRQAMILVANHVDVPRDVSDKLNGRN